MNRLIASPLHPLYNSQTHFTSPYLESTDDSALKHSKSHVVETNLQTTDQKNHTYGLFQSCQAETTAY